MAANLFQRNRGAKVLGWLAGIALVGLAGQLCLLPFGDGLARLSYDLPFRFLSSSVPDELVMVYSDSKVKQQLGQSPGDDLDRRFCTQLLDRLTREGARLVLFDLLFDYPHADAKVDAAFADAMRAHGKVVLVADYVVQVQGNIKTSSPLSPIAILTNAAAGWGLGTVARDPDMFARRLDSGAEDLPSAGWVAVSTLDAPGMKSSVARATGRWLNYYCKPGELPAVNLDHALAADGLAAGYFRNKIVVVGGRAGEGALAGAKSDEFFTPHARFQKEAAAAGATIHAFSLLNLLHGDWMTRLGFAKESVLVWLWGILITTSLLYFRPWPAMGVAVAAAAGFAVLAMYVQIHHRIWFAWLAPAAVQTFVALIWSVGFQYMLEARRREKLRRAFAVYYSPYMADRIANSDFDLSLGGQEVEATVMFTDLEGFTAMSETLPPAEVSKLLTAYFSETTRAIFEQDGMIIKYIGDSVMAVWGAPVADPRPAERAVRAAIGMRNAGLKEFRGRRLRTRIGVNTGKVLAGNLGSEFRFDYTLIGEATNYASRLEGLNKYLGTDILISETTRGELSDAIQCRSLGRFLVSGKTKPAEVFEVLGPAAEYRPPPAWLEVFARALGRFQKCELDETERLLREVLVLRGGDDGPAKFYLKEIEKARSQSQTEKLWDGVVVLDAK